MFKVLKLENAEIRHSNFLGWLLDPCESHLMLDYFLKEFLKMIVKDHSINPDVSMSISDIVLGDFIDTEVTLEKITNEGRRIDILLESRKNQFVCVIENKVWSDEGCNQLEDYYQYINNHETYKNYKHKLFVFLTPKTGYDCTQLYKNYIRFDYGKICQIIDKLLKKYKGTISDDVIYFIEDYKEMVERNIMEIKDKEVVELCRRIYKNHKNAIDMIVENTKDIQKEIDDILIKLIKEDETLNLEPCAKGWIRFTPKNVDLNNLKFAKTDWVDSDKILMIEINNTTNNSICADLIIRQAEETSIAQENRSKLVSLASELFNYKQKNKKDTYAHIISKTLIPSGKYYDMGLDDNIEYYLKQSIEDSGIIDDFNNIVNKYN